MSWLTSHERHWDGWHWKRGDGRGSKWKKVQQSCLIVQVFTRSKALGQHHLVLTTVLPTACRRGGTGGEVMTHKRHYPKCYTCISETYTNIYTHNSYFWSSNLIGWEVFPAMRYSTIITTGTVSSLVSLRLQNFSQQCVMAEEQTPHNFTNATLVVLRNVVSRVFRLECSCLNLNQYAVYL